MSNPTNNKRKWDEVKKAMTNRRKGRVAGAKPEGTDVTLTVQRLSEAVEGKCQKYQRMGPLTMVKVDGELTIESVKDACIKEFEIPENKYACDVMAGERGPSLSDISQIKNIGKLIHIRFFHIFPNNRPDKDDIGTTSHRNTESVSSTPSLMARPNTTSITLTESTTTSHSHHKSKSKTDKARQYPVSVSLASMMQLGKLIKPDHTQKEVIEVNLEKFDLNSKTWCEPTKATLNISKKSFDSGGFREAYHATPIAGLSTSTKYVIKKYLPDQIQSIEAVFGSLENHTRKSVQMNALANNFALSLAVEAPPEYGPVFMYNEVYFAKISPTNECVSIEKYIPGTFQKYINNTGAIVKDLQFKERSLKLKAETFVHYTYEKSNRSLMVVDIQGSEYSLYDPEIATCQLNDVKDGLDGEVFFCMGNLSTMAIENFLNQHVCNAYCALLGLRENY